MGIELSPRYKARVAREKRREQRELEDRCRELAGPVVVTRVVGGERPVRATTDSPPSQEGLRPEPGGGDLTELDDPANPRMAPR